MEIIDISAIRLIILFNDLNTKLAKRPIRNRLTQENPLNKIRL